MKLAGVVFVVISAGSVGFRFAFSVSQRCALLGQLILGLNLLKSELSSHGTPIPEALAYLAAATKGSASEYFSAASKLMHQKRWISADKSLEIASEKLKELPAEDPVRSVLRSAALSLGRYDLDSQLCGIEQAVSRLEEIRKAAEQDKPVRCRTYRALGICAGLALAILLV